MLFENIKDVLKCYIVNADGSREIDAETFLPSVCYIKEDQIIDFMYDSFVFLPSPNYLYDQSPGGTGERKPMNKLEWQKYIEEEQFKSGKNIDALNEAVGIAKKELGNTDYKAHIFMSLFYPHSEMHEFGDVGGENLDLKDVSGKQKALKWMVDKSIEEFKKRDYEHLEIGGFYWFTESLSSKPEESNKEFLLYITDYIRSLGYMTIWSVWYGAPGNEMWKEVGFDAAGHQANYFPEHGSWPNQGGKERLTGITEKVKKIGCGVEIEMMDFNERSAEIVNEYYDEGARAGWINSFHLYYMDFGPVLISQISKSDNEVIRSAYDNTYKFINKIYSPQK